jgi:hemoglobin
VSLYDSLGQQAGITAAVDQFYVRVLADPTLSHYFDGADVDKVKEHQVGLLSTVSGGPQVYSGRSMELSHRHLGVTEQAFDTVVGHLADTLDHLGVEPDVRDQVAAVLVAQREHIVTVPATV